MDNAFHLAHENHVANEQISENAQAHQAQHGDEDARRGELRENIREVNARNVEKVNEYVDLKQKNGGNKQQHQDGIDQSLGKNGTYGLREGSPVVVGQYTAAQDLADTRNDQAGSVRQKDGMNAGADAGLLLHGS